MATEPTLGARIQETVFDWVAAGDVLGWGNPRVQEMRVAFVALAARADAAERLAKAVAAVCDAADAVASLDRPDRIQVKREWNVAKAKRGEALAAWRAITEEAQP